MHSKVSINSYNVSAQSAIHNDNYKAKNLKWGGMHRCLPLLRNKVSFLALHKC
jgi:hypothetical protein